MSTVPPVIPNLPAQPVPAKPTPAVRPSRAKKAGTELDKRKQTSIQNANHAREIRNQRIAEQKQAVAKQLEGYESYESGSDSDYEIVIPSKKADRKLKSVESESVEVPDKMYVKQMQDMKKEIERLKRTQQPVTKKVIQIQQAPAPVAEPAKPKDEGTETMRKRLLLDF